MCGPGSGACTCGFESGCGRAVGRRRFDFLRRARITQHLGFWRPKLTKLREDDWRGPGSCAICRGRSQLPRDLVHGFPYLGQPLQLPTLLHARHGKIDLFDDE